LYRRCGLSRALHDLVQGIARLRRQTLRPKHGFDDSAVRRGEMWLALQARAQRVLERLDVSTPGEKRFERQSKFVHAEPELRLMVTPQSLRVARTGAPEK
jgi:hypothetical protein